MIDLSTKINIKSIGLNVNRFWSSPKELPFINIVTIVLARPTFEDVKILTDKYGIELVKKHIEYHWKKVSFLKVKLNMLINLLAKLKGNVVL